MAGGTIFEKIILKNKNVNIKFYQTISFLFISLAIIPLVYFFWKMTPEASETKNITIFILVIITSVAANFLFLYSLKKEKVSNLEPARMLEPLFTILLAIIFGLIFTNGLYDTNSKIMIPGLIAALTLVFSHVRKDHIKFNKYFIAAIFSSLFFALELVISRLILDYYSPFTFYFLRCLCVFIISFALFQPKFSIFEKIDRKTKWIIFATALIWIIYRAIIYYGYIYYGVIFTTLMVMLGPIFVYLFAHLFLKEKIGWRNIISAAIILGCVLYVSLA